MNLDEKNAIHAQDRFVDRVVTLNQVRRVSAESGIHAAASAMQNVEKLGVDMVIQSFQSKF